MSGFSRCTVFWVGMALALTALRAAEIPGWASPPWHGPGAVIPPVTDAERRQDSSSILFSAKALEPGRLKFELSCWKGMDLNSDFNTAKKQWEIRLSAIDGRVAQTLPAGTIFDLKAFQGRGRKADSNEVRNIAVGPVWVLVVSPGTDGFELPKLSDAARRRVRILDLQGSTWADARGAWMGAGEAERLGASAFCGLPRAFANAVCAEANGGGANHAIGLVLVPVRFLQPTLKQIYRKQLSVPMDLDAFLTSAGQTNVWLQAGARAAKMANVSDAPGSNGANQREVRALSAHQAENYDRFREGQLVEPFPSQRHSWRYCVGGVDAQSISANSDLEIVPFRATGIIWGEDQFQQPQRRTP